MPDQKIRVGIADESLTPEEEHKIEVKVDKMVSVDATSTVAAEKSPKSFTIPVTTPNPVAGPPPLPKTANVVSEVVTPEPNVVTPVSEESNSQSLPPELSIPGLPSEEAVVPEPPVVEPLAAVSLDDPLTDTVLAGTVPEESSSSVPEQSVPAAVVPSPKRPSFMSRLKGYYTSWWQNKKVRYGTFTGLVVVLIVLGLVPLTRSFALNLVGFRASATLQVLDGTTQLPLKGVHVGIGGEEVLTDMHGIASLQHIKLGSQQLDIQRVAFAPMHKAVSINFGKNTLGKVSLSAVGNQYKFVVVDYVTGAPVTTAEATSGDANAIADNKGVITLTATNPGVGNLTVAISAPEYRTLTLNVANDSTSLNTVQLVTGHQDLYVTKQSGKYDVYRVDVDGGHKQLVLPGSGFENDQITLLPNLDGTEAALVSTRDNYHDADGYLLQTLTLVDVLKGTPITVDHSQRIQLIDWFGDRIVYAEARAGASAANPSRYLLLSYDYKTKQRIELDHANYFNDIVSAGGSIYYATSNTYSGGTSKFMKVNADGTSKVLLLTNEIWNIFRPDHNDFALSAPNSWFSYRLGDSKPVQTQTAYKGAPKLYVDSPDGKHSAWVDTRDGKGALIIYDSTTQKETVLVEQAGITNPLRWLTNDIIAYRVVTPSETADYVVSLDSPPGKKITDVTNAAGLSLWYYY